MPKLIAQLLALFLTANLAAVPAMASTSVSGFSYLVSRLETTRLLTRNERRETRNVPFGTEALSPAAVAGFEGTKLSDQLSAAATSALFNGMSAATVKKILQRGKPRSFDARDVLTSRGHPIDGVRLVTSGTVKVAHIRRDGSEVILDVVPAGGVLGADQLRYNPSGTLSATSQAMEAVQALYWESSLFIELCKEYPLLSQNLTRLMYSDLNFLRERICETTGLDPDLMMLSRFVLLARRIAPGKEMNILFKMIHEELGWFVDAKRETITRFVKRHNPVIYSGRNGVVITSIRAIMPGGASPPVSISGADIGTILDGPPDAVISIGPPASPGPGQTTNMIRFSSGREMPVPPLFAGLSPSDITSILGHARLKRFNDSKKLSRQDEPVSEVMLIKSGKVKSSKRSRYDDGTLTRLNFPGGMLGAEEHQNNRQKLHMFSNEAYGSVEVFVWDENRFQKLCDEYPMLTVNTRRMMYKELISLRERLKETTTIIAASTARIAYELVQLARQMDPLSTGTGTVTIRLGQILIAELAQVSRESVNRFMQFCFTHGLATGGKTGFTIHVRTFYERLNDLLEHGLVRPFAPTQKITRMAA
jgi:CRP-like cAMP-binding protein